MADLDAGKPVIVLNQGTVATDPTELLQPGLAALADEDVLVVAVTGGRDPRELGALPANARAERYIPFDRLLPKADVLVTNAGFGAIQLALAAGVPIVAAGKTEDKVEVAARVGWSGVGINLRTQRPRQESITAAVRRVLSDDRFRQRAHELQGEITSAGREQGAAEELERLCSATAADRWESRLERPAGMRLVPEPGVGDLPIAGQAERLATSAWSRRRSSTAPRRSRAHDSSDTATARDGRGRPGDERGLDDVCPSPGGGAQLPTPPASGHAGCRGRAMVWMSDVCRRRWTSSPPSTVSLPWPRWSDRTAAGPAPQGSADSPRTHALPVPRTGSGSPASPNRWSPPSPCKR